MYQHYDGVTIVKGSMFFEVTKDKVEHDKFSNAIFINNGIIEERDILKNKKEMSTSGKVVLL